MESQTVKTRVASLVQKCRKAIRLYTTMGNMQGNDLSDQSDRQIQVWREVNSDLLGRLTHVARESNVRALVTELYGLRDQFYQEWREAEAELHRKQKDLIRSAENADFIKAVMLGRELVVAKARTQACHAAYHELQEVVERSKTPYSAPVEELPDEQSPLLAQAKVIPLRRKLQ